MPIWKLVDCPLNTAEDPFIFLSWTVPGVSESVPVAGKWKTVVNTAFYFIIRGKVSDEKGNAFVHIGIAADKDHSQIGGTWPCFCCISCRTASSTRTAGISATGAVGFGEPA